MPRGAKPGERRGGRIKGKPNKATIEKALLAERDVKRARIEGRPLAKENLDAFMGLFTSMAAFYQPTITRPGDPNPPPRNPHGDETKFKEWAILAVDASHKLAPYQSPTFRAITVVPPPPEDTGQQQTVFEVRIFSHDNKLIEHITDEKR